MIRWLSPRDAWSALVGRMRLRRPAPAVRRFTVEQVDRVLLGMPDLERAVYLNHSKGGLSYARIARQLGITTDEVEQIMTRAIFHLICAFADLERERRP